MNNKLIKAKYYINGGRISVTCDDCRAKYEYEKRMCRDNNYKYLVVGEVKLLAKMEEGGPTCNALFDEYWFNYY